MKQKTTLIYVSYALIKALLVLSLFTESATAAPVTKTPGKWNFLVYIASNNNLHRYGQHNIKEMQQIGSNDNVNIFVQVDNFGKRQVSRYKIEKGKSTLISTHANPPTNLSGTKENLFDFVREITTKHPADRLALILWNHGSGAKDPHLWSRLLPYLRENCFYFNPQTKMYEIDRNVVSLRGIAFNDVGHTYITNPELKVVLEQICTQLRGGKKIDLLGFDACHMAAVEVAGQVKNAADYMVGSEEIEPGPGWDYSKFLRNFLTRNLTPSELAEQIVNAYGAKYNRMFADLTQSAIKLENHHLLEKNIDTVATLLLALLEKPEHKLLTVIRKVRSNPRQTISFLDSDYIDLGLFYKSLAQELTKRVPNPTPLVENLKTALQDGTKILQSQVVFNTTGRNVKEASGLSIYFPTKSLHTSYLKNSLAQTTNWGTFVHTYLKKNKRRLMEKYKAE